MTPPFLTVVSLLTKFAIESAYEKGVGGLAAWAE